NFAYFQPTSIDEAITQYKELTESGKTVHYFSGGTEFISRARRNEIFCDAVIDIKKIPETNVMGWDDDQLIVGACCNLSTLVCNQFFPLLSDVTKQIATQTERNKITLGGNIASNLPYREAILPFLLADSEIIIAGEEGTRQLRLNDIYQHGKLLDTGEFIVQLITERRWTNRPYMHLRKTKQSHINYPIVSLVAMKDGADTRIAISGFLDYPFRFKKMETLFKDNEKGNLDKAIDSINASPQSDSQATEKYRQFVLRSMLEKIQSMKGAS